MQEPDEGGDRQGVHHQRLVGKYGRAHALYVLENHIGAGGYSKEEDPQPVVEDKADGRGEAVCAVLHGHREGLHAGGGARVRGALIVLLDHCKRSDEQPCEHCLLQSVDVVEVRGEEGGLVRHLVEREREPVHFA